MINAVTKSVMLQLLHDFYHTVFKIKHNLYIASRSATPPHPLPLLLPVKNSAYAPGFLVFSHC